MIKQELGINLNDLGQLAKANPKYATLFGELAGVDQIIKNFATDTVTNYADPNIYYIKTELLINVTIFIYIMQSVTLRLVKAGCSMTFYRNVNPK